VDQFTRFEAFREIIVRGFHETLSNNPVRIPVLVDIKPVDTLLQGVKSRRGRVHLKTNAASDRQRGKSEQNPELDKVVFQGKHFDVCLLSQPQHRPVVELNLCPAILSGVDPIS
jgi:hypothetical protein